MGLGGDRGLYLELTMSRAAAQGRRVVLAAYTEAGTTEDVVERLIDVAETVTFAEGR